MKHKTCNKNSVTRNLKPKYSWLQVSGYRLQERGFTLFYAVLVSSLLLALGLAIFNITYKELILSSGARESATAFYAADAGLECALFWDRKYTGLSSPVFGFYGDSLASGLAGYWRFEEGSGGEAFDSSGHANTGTLVGMDNSAWVSGQIGGGLSFDGIDDYVEVEDSDGLSLTGDMTITAWVRPTDLVGYNGIVGKTVKGNASPYDLYTIPETGAVRFSVGGGGSSQDIETEKGLSAGMWQHVVAIRSGSTGRIYINGSQVASGSLGVSPVDDGGTLRIGSRDDASTMMKGSLDDVRIYNRVLSAAEIEAIAEQKPNIIFTDPVEPDSGATCVGADITHPANGWETATSTTAATTSFDILFPSGRCASVDVFKNIASTTIVSRGYNTCDTASPRRVERAIRAIY